MEEGDEDLIEHGAVGSYEMAKHGGACLTRGERGSADGAEVLGGDADGLGATDADDADGATLGGGNGADGVLGMAHKNTFRLFEATKIRKTSE